MKSFKQHLYESGLKRALDTGDLTLMQQELTKRRAKVERLNQEAAALNMISNHKGAAAADGKFAQVQALKPGIEDLTMPLEAQGIKTGVKLSELPSEKPWHDDELTPDYYDGSDDNVEGSSSEVESAQQQNQYSGNLKKPFPSPSEMASKFFTQGRKVQ
jgi:hypothetical protein